MFGMGFGELIVILIIVLLVFGRRLPEIGEGLGRGIRGFRKEVQRPDEIDVTPPKPGAEGDQSRKDDGPR